MRALPDAGGEREHALADSRPDAFGGVAAAALERELAPEGVVDALLREVAVASAGSGVRGHPRVLMILPSRGSVEAVLVRLALKLGSDLKHHLIDGLVEGFAGAVTRSANQAQCSIDIFRSVRE
jgi:hypothetical protein